MLRREDRPLADNERLAGLQNAAIREVVEAFDLRNLDVDALGDRPQRIAGVHGADYRLME